MNRILIHVIILVFLPIALVGCTNRFASIPSAILQKAVIPQGSDLVQIGYNTAGVTSSNTENNDISTDEITSVLPAGYLVLAYEWEKLDRNEIEESVIAFSSQDSNLVQVLVGHYNVNTSKYNFVWQGVSNAIVNNEFTLVVEDITGNFRKEIVVMGVDEEGHQVVDIFGLPTTDRYALKDYTNLFTVSSMGGGDIEIEEYERSSNYENGESYGESYSIVVYNVYQDKNQIEKVYYKWNYLLGKYYQDSSEVFSQNDIAEQQLRSLYISNDDVWKAFLSGVWVKKQNTTSNVDVDVSRTFIYFSPKVPNISIVTDDSLLLYRWVSMIRTFSERGIGIRVRLQDLVLPQLRDIITVEVISQDRVFITFSEGAISEFSGMYVVAKAEYGSGISYLRSFSNGMNQKIVNFRQWLQGKIYVKTANEYYFFSSTKARVVSENALPEKQLYYDVFYLGDDIFLELKEKDYDAVFYRVKNFDSISQSEYPKVHLQPYILTASTLYLDINKTPLVFSKQ